MNNNIVKLLLLATKQNTPRDELDCYGYMLYVIVNVDKQDQKCGINLQQRCYISKDVKHFQHYGNSFRLPIW